MISLGSIERSTQLLYAGCDGCCVAGHGSLIRRRSGSFALHVNAAEVGAFGNGRGATTSPSTDLSRISTFSFVTLPVTWPRTIPTWRIPVP